MLRGIGARELDHVAREIDDAHRLAHVEHEDLAAASLQPRLQQQLRRFRQRHEVARDLRMRDGDRAAARDLLAKARDHAARAAEHVAEAHEHELRPRALQALAHHLREALGRAHHVGRIDRLVRRHENELLDASPRPPRARARRCRTRCCAPPATRWSPPSAARACRRAAWKMTLGLLAREHVVDERGVLDVADHGRRAASCGKASPSAVRIS